jgi:hypothetical protein
MKLLPAITFMLLCSACSHTRVVQDGKTTAKYFNVSTDVVSVKKNDTFRVYKKLLVTGMGGIPTRHFITTLSPHLIDYCKTKQTECVYEFIGKGPLSPRQQLQAFIDKHQADAALIILQGDDDGGIETLDFDRTVYRAFTDFGGPRQNIFRTKVIISQNLKLILQETGARQAVWLGEMYVQGDAGYKGMYVKACNAITKELGNNLIMP